MHYRDVIVRKSNAQMTFVPPKRNFCLKGAPILSSSQYFHEAEKLHSNEEDPTSSFLDTILLDQFFFSNFHMIQFIFPCISFHHVKTDASRFLIKHAISYYPVHERLRILEFKMNDFKLDAHPGRGGN